MAWVFLILAGIMEWGWPVGLKYAWTEEQGFRFWPAAAAVVFMIASGGFLLLAQHTIPMGTAYAVWTGIGAVGAFAIGIWLFKEPAQVFRILSVCLIIVGIVGLKLTSDH
jgi:quaternary ammonium compound-resistance protein SugE